MPPDHKAELGMLQRTQAIAAQFELNKDHLEHISNRFVHILESGLASPGPIQLPSFVTKLPSGRERGTYLSVDLGGTNCRICSVTLHGDSTYTLLKCQRSITRELRVNPSHEPLFRFIANEIKVFLETQLEHPHGKSSWSAPWSLGFTFSFACAQSSPSRATLLRWDKDWDIPSAIGQDPCLMLQEQLDVLGLPVAVTAMANDSVSTLLTRAYTASTSTPTLVGAIFGTGTNAAYVERLDAISSLGDWTQSPHERPSAFMILNTEWGALDQEMKVLPRTCFDNWLDQESNNPGQQALEKRMCGLYLPELLRLILLRLWTEGAMVMELGNDSPVLQKDGLDGAFLSDLSRAGPEQLRAMVAANLKASNVSDEEAQAVRMLGSAVVERAARLAGAALGAIVRLATRSTTTSATRTKLRRPSIQPKIHQEKLRRSGRWRLFRLGFRWSSASAIAKRDLIDIGVDGSLIRHYPGFEDMLRAAMRELTRVGPKVEPRLRISFVEDGSAVGAALMAMIVSESGGRKPSFRKT